MVQRQSPTKSINGMIFHLFISPIKVILYDRRRWVLKRNYENQIFSNNNLTIREEAIPSQYLGIFFLEISLFKVSINALFILSGLFPIIIFVPYHLVFNLLPAPKIFLNKNLVCV